MVTKGARQQTCVHQGRHTRAVYVCVSMCACVCGLSMLQRDRGEGHVRVPVCELTPQARRAPLPSSSFCRAMNGDQGCAAANLRSPGEAYSGCLCVCVYVCMCVWPVYAPARQGGGPCSGARLRTYAASLSRGNCERVRLGNRSLAEACSSSRAHVRVRVRGRGHVRMQAERGGRVRFRCERDEEVPTTFWEKNTKCRAIGSSRRTFAAPGDSKTPPTRDKSPMSMKKKKKQSPALSGRTEAKKNQARSEGKKPSPN